MPSAELPSRSDLPAAQRHALEAWADQATAAGWLPATATDALQSVTTSAPGQLFDAGDRPLVAGLFGGTGVGKSTLLNRLAGESIARASVERPTSRDITVYVHRSQVVDRLPNAFPMERMRTALHNNEQYRHVMFIDMPDFDSVESANRDLVDVWLPHLDVVLYVVSPERYRDDQGWRLLLQHAHEHAWLFVMNHWDRGDPLQLDDFRQQLSAAGMSEPLIFRSDSSGKTDAQGRQEDDFARLCSTLAQLADESIVKSLNELGILARLKALKEASDPWLVPLGSEEQISALQSAWQEHWSAATKDLDQTLLPRAQQLARQYADDEGSWLSRWRGKPQRQAEIVTGSLIDDALLGRLDTVLGDFLNQQGQASAMPLAALKQAVAQPYARARRDFAATVDDTVNRSLALPGGVWQRRLHAGLGALCLLLPLAAMGWIGWRVVSAFAQGGSNSAAYLGSNFAINGALLLALAWLIPAFLQKKTRPSREKAALRGARDGLAAALAQTSAAVGEGFGTLNEQSRALREQYHSLWQSLPRTGGNELPETVRRMLASEISQPAQRALDVRANTHSSTDATPVS
ncbi:GTPase [Granulosicoccus sp. 3-233]|uniref:GTPase n=1 Tax=Granulosicoccus sp. 3-233 TaxID=3417969 RepID=UPI003D3366D0